MGFLAEQGHQPRGGLHSAPTLVVETGNAGEQHVIGREEEERRRPWVHLA